MIDITIDDILTRGIETESGKGSLADTFRTVSELEKRSRPSMDETYLKVARSFAERSSCLRRGYGAVIVKEKIVVSIGYNGGVRGGVNCCNRGQCKRKSLQIPQGERYELCEAIHAEVNACLNARADLKGSTLYLYGIDFKTGLPVENIAPCMICEKVIRNVGIAEIKFYQNENIKTVSLHTDQVLCGRNGVW